eukprot:EC714424.1.p2 GENE.EC714424.1~~EC714424.1.p2  ORF type:complete len:71 (+),score=4.57 EC714424.1:120-332(+)
MTCPDDIHRYPQPCMTIVGSFDHRGKKHRTIFSAEQKSALERMLAENPFPDKKQREELATRIGVNNTQEC